MTGFAVTTCCKPFGKRVDAEKTSTLFCLFYALCLSCSIRLNTLLGINNMQKITTINYQY